MQRRIVTRCDHCVSSHSHVVAACTRCKPGCKLGGGCCQPSAASLIARSRPPPLPLCPVPLCSSTAPGRAFCCFSFEPRRERRPSTSALCHRRLLASSGSAPRGEGRGSRRGRQPATGRGSARVVAARAEARRGAASLSHPLTRSLACAAKSQTLLASASATLHLAQPCRTAMMDSTSATRTIDSCRLQQRALLPPRPSSGSRPMSTRPDQRSQPQLQRRPLAAA